MPMGRPSGRPFVSWPGELYPHPAVRAGDRGASGTPVHSRIRGNLDAIRRPITAVFVVQFRRFILWTASQAESVVQLLAELLGRWNPGAEEGSWCGAEG